MNTSSPNSVITNNEQTHHSNESATIGGGCFWCLDAIFREIKGIISVTSGFSGGVEVNPSYELACSGKTGHIEVVQIQFNPSKLSYHALLSIFFAGHDPTQTNGQGHDIGPQYRSVIFCHTQQQQQTARQMIETIDGQPLWPDKIATKVTAYKTFYSAPSEHQNFYQLRTTVPYCQIIIRPKLLKIRQLFAEMINL
jgi:methionine-S-sulfoxide reductase